MASTMQLGDRKIKAQKGAVSCLPNTMAKVTRIINRLSERKRTLNAMSVSLCNSEFLLSKCARVRVFFIYLLHKRNSIKVTISPFRF